ncbi:hypothetical protein E9993_10815 [Labilibacter sediminis]|nr:hypothetical protein E9993_10815 [Labilibacter sediminis]
MRGLVLILFIVIFKGNLCSQNPTVELRGAWVATVANIDWPSSKTLSIKEQKAEIVSILDFYQQHNFNTLFVQVRPSADTFYPSKYEPWSRYLTGSQGKGPGYNPLKFWIKETHKRGIEFHAWINPYRITNSKNEKLHKKHPALKHPEWVVTYGGKKYYNPGLDKCKAHIINIVKEIVEGYEVDGIHFDDYFYPYPVGGEEFPDSMTYKPFKNKYPNINDWRRENVNQTIRQLNESIKKIDPNVKFGVSPFGVWRNKKDDVRGSDTGAGVTNYDHLYADVLKWLDEGWIDYVTPQLYWSTDHPAVPFEHLTRWWTDNAYGKSVYVGHALYKLNGDNKVWQDPDQMVHQLKYVRNNPVASGSVFFSHRHFKKNELGFTDSLKVNLYKYPSLVPSMRWIDNHIPSAPLELTVKKDQLRWKHKRLRSEGKENRYAIYVFKKGGLKQLMLLTDKRKINISDVLKSEEDVFGFQVTTISKTNNESKGSNVVYL